MNTLQGLELRVRVNTHPTRPRGFTLVELLVTITIIGILAALAWGAVVMARNAAREAATKATIAKLNSVVMKRYESYMTRRMPIKIPRELGPTAAAALRLTAVGDLMRMEMPVTAADINWVPQALPAPPSLTTVYRASPPSNIEESAQCLYLIVSKGSPEAMEQFNASEIGVTTDGKLVFIDGWGMPIRWLRSAPWVTDIQPDPLVPFPYIYSAGPNKTFGTSRASDDINNHSIEQR
jgi:prepilin-type N-terminal cleavage/methylation domain-containing protein